METYFFIGHHKTGSTAIQRHLAIHYQDLLKCGYLYPFVDLLSILCGRLTRCFDEPGEDARSLLQARIHALAKTKNFLEPHNGLAFLMQHEATGSDMPAWHSGLPSSSDEIFALVREQLDDCGAHAMMIASEVMSNFGAAGQGLVQRLLGALPDSERHLLAILRRPDDYLHSWYCQELCFGYPRLGSLPQRLCNLYLDSIHVDYRLMLREWVDSSAFAQVTITNYHDVLGQGGSIQWFLQNIGLGENLNATIANPHQRLELSNQSLHPAFVNLVRRTNTSLPINKALQMIRLLKTLGQSDGLPAPADVELLGLKSRSLLCEHFAPINSYLGTLVNRSLFFMDVDCMEQERRLPLREVEADAARIAIEKLTPQLYPRQLEILEDWARGLGVTISR